MERYFIGNNTAYGFRSFYEDELRDCDRAILLKGGPGTGKSTLLKKIAKKCVLNGLDHEEWYCSGDPSSLDGIYIKPTKTLIMDATSPHAFDPKYPVVKEVIYNLAECLDGDILSPNRAMIEKLIFDKTRHYTRAYQYLKCALCHYNNKINLQKSTADARKIKEAAYSCFENLNAEICSERRRRAVMGKEQERKRNVFVRAISPHGENEFFDFIGSREVISVRGGDYVRSAFFNELDALLGQGITVRLPLEPANVDGVVLTSKVMISSSDFYDEAASEIIELGAFEGRYDFEACEEETAEERKFISKAEEELNAARGCHMNVEKYYIAAMNFEKLEKLDEQIISAAIEA